MPSDILHVVDDLASKMWCSAPDPGSLAAIVIDKEKTSLKQGKGKKVKKGITFFEAGLAGEQSHFLNICLRRDTGIFLGIWRL